MTSTLPATCLPWGPGAHPGHPWAPGYRTPLHIPEAASPLPGVSERRPLLGSDGLCVSSCPSYQHVSGTLIVTSASCFPSALFFLPPDKSQHPAPVFLPMQHLLSCSQASCGPTWTAALLHPSLPRPAHICPQPSTLHRTRQAGLSSAAHCHRPTVVDAGGRGTDGVSPTAVSPADQHWSGIPMTHQLALLTPQGITSVDPPKALRPPGNPGLSSTRPQVPVWCLMCALPGLLHTPPTEA